MFSTYSQFESGPYCRASRRAAFFLAALCLLPDAARGDDSASLENRVKTAFVLNFIQFTDWPASAFAKPEDPIVIGLVNSHPLEAALASAIEGKTVKGRPMVIRRVAFPGPISGCHVLLVGPQEQEQVPAIIQALGNANILTIGDPGNFTDAGGIIRFYLEDRKERFEINTAAAERAHLQMSSKLLKLAKIIGK